MNVGRIVYPDTYRVRASSDRSVLSVAPVINANQEALAALQKIVAELEERVAALEASNQESRSE